jgi:hypothetical protein
MAQPAGESDSDALRLDFDRRLKVEFHGSSVLLRRGAPCFGGDVSRGQTLWLSIRPDL